MSDIIFPTELPPPLQSGFTRGFDASSTRTDFEVGVPRKRRGITAAPILVGLSWDFSRPQFDLFDDWFINDLENGALQFDIFIEGLWYEANFVDTPPYSLTVDDTEARYVVDAKILLGVGPNSGITELPTLKPLSATLRGYGWVTGTVTRSAIMGATLHGAGHLTGALVALGPLEATLVGAGAITTIGELPLAADLTGEWFLGPPIYLDTSDEVQRVWLGVVWSPGGRSSDIDVDEQAVRREFLGV